MGLKRLLKSLWTGKDKTVSTFFDDGSNRKQLIPRDQQSPTKTRKSSTGFRSIFKPAFSKPKAKKNNPTEATVTVSITVVLYLTCAYTPHSSPPLIRRIKP